MPMHTRQADAGELYPIGPIRGCLTTPRGGSSSPVLEQPRDPFSRPRVRSGQFWWAIRVFRSE